MPLDVSDVARFTDSASARLDAIPAEVLGFVEAAADALQQTDPYQDRTGDLRSGTRAVNVSDDPDAWEFELEMDTKYASYVQDLGFSRFDEVGEAFAVVIGAHLLGMTFE